mgnify:CR=1 FL=1
MRKVFFEKRCIIICSPDDPALSDPNAIQFRLGENIDIHTLIDMVETSDSLQRTCIPTDDIEATYRKICSEFIEVNAGGGLVSNRRGDFLLINRNGLWDLPKGHQDPGEPIDTTALREVQEETGIDNLELRDLICITDHCYRRNEKWHLKHTWWYSMKCTCECDLVPQTEEGITEVRWVAKTDLAEFLQQTYPTIVEVFRAMGLSEKYLPTVKQSSENLV